MNRYRLSFGEINILSNSLAEVIVDEGIIMDGVMVDEYHDFLLSNLEPPFGLLVNKKYSYSYTFEAQTSIASLPEIKAMAIVINSQGGLMSTETLIKLNEASAWNIKMFHNREAAVTWLDLFLSNHGSLEFQSL